MSWSAGANTCTSHAVRCSPMDLTGHHSNPSRPLRAVLDWAESRDSRANRPLRVEAKHGRGVIAAAHPRHDRIVAAVISVLGMHPGPMRAHDVHLAVEGILGTPVRWASVKACLASNVGGPSSRFVRVARGRYRLATGQTPG